MKKTIKLLSLILCVILAVSLVTACDKGSGTPSGSGSQAPADSSPASSQPPPASEPPAQKKVLRVGMECDFPPHNWTQLEANQYTMPMPDGTFADGYDVQIAKIIADKLDYDLQVVKVDWDGLPPSLTSNKIDLIIAGMTDTEDRRLVLDFTDIYWSSDLVIVVMKDGPYANATKLADFSGAKITGQIDTLHYDLIDDIPGAVKQLAMDDFPTMLMSLSSGRIDGYVAETPAAVSAQISNPNVTYIKFEGDNGFGEEMPVSIGLRHGEDALRDQINAILAGITPDQRQQLMEEAVTRQPLQG